MSGPVKDCFGEQTIEFSSRPSGRTRTKQLLWTKTVRSVTVKSNHMDLLQAACARRTTSFLIIVVLSTTRSEDEMFKTKGDREKRGVDEDDVAAN